MQQIQHDGVKRTYLVRNAAAAGNNPRALVLVLHGGGGNAHNAEQMTGFTGKAIEEGFTVVYPQGSGHRQNRRLTWNAGLCCAYAMQQRVDDVGFINALIDKLVEDYAIDHRRIYVTGMSNGGMMTHRLGIHLADKIAAIAPVAATVFEEEARPASPLSVLIINGSKDESVPVNGGAPGGRFRHTWGTKLLPPAKHQADYWAATNGCQQPGVETSTNGVTETRLNCPAGIAVEHYVLHSLGHAWPGGNRVRLLGEPANATLQATDFIWEFFRQHPAPVPLQ
ncbi:PHB depolymerase family esterase [Pseudomaricurvus sp. HS19]|uniref:extracellular catalytic domain type 1 short-chain-length polyhydroxyalkanoate depolymerase n=1 Tax=Pseudomaricurvus sp. HS19 TaxID=2692626 RepID=UPI00136E9576|nr:PHB depolymerase family esterase [Pseudomaricurvus sp. HS19]MYM63897.1 polyhydroxybutyrate depolymerase [Pseudomaricurvus sp. HS19]